MANIRLRKHDAIHTATFAVLDRLGRCCNGSKRRHWSALGCWGSGWSRGWVPGRLALQGGLGTRLATGPGIVLGISTTAAMGAGDLLDGEVHELILTGEVHVHELLHNEQKSPEGPEQLRNKRP